MVGVFTLVSKDGGRVTKGFDDLVCLSTCAMEGS